MSFFRKRIKAFVDVLKETNRFFIFLLIGSLTITILLLGLVFCLYTQGEIHPDENIRFSNLQKQYPLLSKRVLMDLPQDILINFLDLRQSLKDQVSSYGADFSFYFEYLPSGTSIGVNSGNEFHAASLFKVPVIMAYFHYLERTGAPDKEVTIAQSEIDSQYGNLWKKGAGYKIKLSEAVRLALVNSDNTAAKVVADNIDDQDFQPVYDGLDIQLETDAKGALVTTKNYSSILKALYFASVINRGDSEKILDLLTQTPFNKRLDAGVPDGITVSHKIGDYLDKDGNKALTDCGIVYVPRRPYSLCMLSTTDAATTQDRMRRLSKTIYDFVVSQ